MPPLAAAAPPAAADLAARAAITPVSPGRGAAAATADVAAASEPAAALTAAAARPAPAFAAAAATALAEAATATGAEPTARAALGRALCGLRVRRELRGARRRAHPVAIRMQQRRGGALRAGLHERVRLHTHRHVRVHRQLSFGTAIGLRVESPVKLPQLVWPPLVSKRPGPGM